MGVGKIPFTATALNSLSVPETGRDTWTDTRTPNLQIRVTPTGVKSFCWYGRPRGGAPERVTLGRWPEMSIDDARVHAANLNASAANGESAATQRRDVQAEMTFADFFSVYLEQYAKARKKTWRDDEHKFKVHLLPLHKKKMSGVTRQDVARIHIQIGKNQPAFANRVLALVSKVFNVAVEFGMWEGTNPATRIRHFKEQSRDRFLSSEEIQRFLNALAEEPSDVIRSFFMVSLLTGARRANVLAMRWDQIDLDRSVWKIPETKNGRPVTVPLVPMVAELLKSMDQGSDWVFPSPRSSASGHLQEPRKAWERILARAGIEDAHIHDLRRTMGSWQAITGASLPVIGKSLGHASQQATAIYARLNLDPVRAAMEKATDAMMGNKFKS
ncbi:MAG: tyrosine-type recombinase/integrase [Magnetococcales bacterium]|nr:tyrosine-type recombinase/integrase [Magnetococcales bacterium]